MTKQTLTSAIAEAERFLEKAKLAQCATWYGPPISMKSEDPQKEISACRRASMDLTRALADLRQNR